VDDVLSALYEVISGPPGYAVDMDRLRKLFVTGARLTAVHRNKERQYVVEPLSLADFMARAWQGPRKEGFFEREIARRTEEFGHITHVFSTYETRRAPGDAKAFQRGVNSIQLVNDGSGWKVLSLLWDSERPDNPIPSKYLPAAGH
jgi:hypothetical protein